MGAIRSIGRVLHDDLERVDFSNIKLMSRNLASRPRYSQFREQADSGPAFWQRPGLEKRITNVCQPHIVQMDLDPELERRLIREIRRASLFDREVFGAENAANEEFAATGEKLHRYRTFDVQITAGLLFCPSLLELALRNFAGFDGVVQADAITVEIGEQPLGLHNAYNPIGRDNFHGITELASSTNYHLNLNTGEHHERQSPFVVWLGADETVFCARHGVGYLLQTDGLIDRRNREVLLEDLFAAENCWEPVTDHSLSKAAVLNILDPLYYKARYCRGPRQDAPEGIYAVTRPDEAFVFSACMIHSTNYFAPATEQRTSAILRTHRREDISPDFIACYLPGSTNSGVAAQTRVRLEEERQRRVDGFYEKVFGYEGVRRKLSLLSPLDTATVDALRLHYEKASWFFQQDRFELSTDARRFVRDYFRQEHGRRADAA